MIGKRDNELEERLQKTIDSGNRVFAVGDVHGHYEMLVDLLDSLNLTAKDHVVLLGDLIDRGPDSNLVIDLVQKSPNIHAIKGNHEEQMLGYCDPDKFENPGWKMLTQWYYMGGKATAESYMRKHMLEDGTTNMYAMKKDVGRHLAFLDALPDHIVLKRWRLVHAGYNPQSDYLPDEQDTDVLRWVRKDFIGATETVDDERCIVHGHTVTFKRGVEQGDPLESKTLLPDGRPISIGIDTCAYAGDNPCLLAFQLD